MLSLENPVWREKQDWLVQNIGLREDVKVQTELAFLLLNQEKDKRRRRSYCEPSQYRDSKQAVMFEVDGLK